MAKKAPFSIINGAYGYITKPLPTLASEHFLIGGSQNMIITALGQPGENLFVVASRGGYSLFGVADTTAEPVDSEMVWRTNRGVELFLRKTDTNLQVYLTQTGAWEDLLTTLDADYPARFETIWNGTELIDELLFVNHSTTLYSWTGAVGTLPNGDADVASGTIDIDESIGEQGFLTSGTRSIMVKDTGGTWRTTAYTGQSGSQFTVSSNLSGFTFAAGAPVVQVVRSNATTPASGFTNDVIRVLDNQVWIGSHSSRRVYTSANDDYADYTFSSPRLPGEGALRTLDDVTTAFEIGNAESETPRMVIFSGRSRAYGAYFEITQGDSADREISKTDPLPIAPNQGAVSQELVARSKNAIIFLNGDNELVELGAIENVTQLQYVPISDPIKTDFDAATFTNGHIKFKKNIIYITAPTDGKMYMFDLVNRFWNPPQIVPFRMLSDYSSSLYGHSNSMKETYKAFDGLSDNGNPISFRAHFAYRNGGKREIYKNFNRYYLEFFMTVNATVIQKLIYEYLGSRAVQQFEYKGTQNKFIIALNQNVSLGINSLGTNPLGGSLTEPENLLKYRRIKKVNAIDHFEYQARYECDSDDAQFYVVAQGPNMGESSNYPTSIEN